MTGGPWEISNDPDNKWAISPEDWEEMDSPEAMAPEDALNYAVSTGFPVDERYHRLRAVLVDGEEVEDESQFYDYDLNDLTEWLDEQEDEDKFTWRFEHDRSKKGEFIRYLTSYLADM